MLIYLLRKNLGGFVMNIKHDFFQDALAKMPDLLANADHFK